jgi:hypothetical protein
VLIASIVALMKEAVSASETSVNFYETPCNIPEDSQLHTRRRENLKPQIFSISNFYQIQVSLL